MAVVGLGLYFTGLHKEAIGIVQRAVLAPGFIKPEIYDQDERIKASFAFDLIDQNGHHISFKSFKGKTIFLNLWATWCPPCIAEMPDINNLYNELDSDRVAFVMISRDNDFGHAIKFVSKKEYDFPIYSLRSRLPEEFQTSSIPNTFVISPKGEIVAKRIGMAKYNTDEFRQFISEL